MQGDDGCNVLTPMKIPSAETNPHLKLKRDHCDDLNPPPTKPIVVGDILLVNFPGIVSSYWCS